MELYNTTDKEKSIIHQAWFLCSADITSYPLVDVVRNINIGYEELVGKLITSDGGWQYDDTNYTDHPRGVGTLFEGQQDYAFSSEYLQIETIEVKDSNGNWHQLKPIDHLELDGVSPDEHWGVDSSGNPQTGLPQYFDQNGDTIRLYPAPTSGSVTLASGLRIWFKRAPDLFTTSDTTQEPGLPSPYHALLAYMAALPYNEIYHPERIARQQLKVNQMTEDLLNFYAHREQSRPKQIISRSSSYR